MSNTSRDPSPASSSGFPPPGAVGSRLAIGSIMIDRVCFVCGLWTCGLLCFTDKDERQQAASAKCAASNPSNKRENGRMKRSGEERR